MTSSSSISLPDDMSPFPPRIFTIGHSNHTVEAFFKLLARYRIRELVDVRSIPSSGRFPQFKKQSIEKLCSSNGLIYRHCPQLGNKGVDGGIAALLRKPEGRLALAELATAARSVTLCGPASAFMCAEADWRDCHRQVVAHKLLEEHGIVTSHILRNGEIERHPTDHVLPEYYGVQSRLALNETVACCDVPQDVSQFEIDVLAPGLQNTELGQDPLSTIQQTETAFGSNNQLPTEDCIDVPRSRRWGKAKQLSQ